MDSIVEIQRFAHEEIEKLEIAIVNEYKKPAKTQREKVAQEHCVNRLVERIAKRSAFLQEIYEDKDGQRRVELEALSGPTEFNEFYQRLKTLKDYHRRFPNEAAVPLEAELMELEKQRDLVMEELENLFSGEESYGRFLDFNALYDQYINLKQFEKIDYSQFVSEFDKFHDIPREKKNSAYQKYLEAIITYLEGFIKRAKPLTDLSKIFGDLEMKFEEDWAEKKVTGWEPQGESEDKSLYCAACVKSFAKKSVFDAHLTGKKHLKAAELLNSKKIDVVTHEKLKERRDDERDKQVAWAEIRVSKLAELLGEERENTKSNIERKQARNTGEREEDVEMEEEEESDSDDEDRPYNPLNLPLGWDGKPIPYWLYKLHGLGVEYKCEICGNYTYMGRKPFERHFTEWRHTYGLRCLGIPNIKHFAEVTTIEDATSLWGKIQKEKDKVVFKPDQEEEYEDQRGNVFNKRTYEDLRRQGLL